MDNPYHTGPAIEWGQILYSMGMTVLCVVLGNLICYAAWKIFHRTKKVVGQMPQPSDTVVGEKPHKRAPAYNTPEKAALYEAMEGRALPEQWRK